MIQTYAAIIPVAGLSSRMGSFKPLLKLKGASMIDLTVRSILDANIQSVCVVTGREAQKVEEALYEIGHKPSPEHSQNEYPSSFTPHLLFAHNRHYASTDMLQSIKCGLNALLDEAHLNASPEPQAIFIIPGDMPAVNPSTFSLLKETSEKTEGCSVFVPSFEERGGHPLLIRKECYRAVLEFEGEGGLRKALADFDRCKVPTSDPGILLDADTPEAFEKLKAYLS